MWVSLFVQWFPWATVLYVGERESNIKWVRVMTATVLRSSNENPFKSLQEFWKHKKVPWFEKSWRQVFKIKSGLGFYVLHWWSLNHWTDLSGRMRRPKCSSASFSETHSTAILNRNLWNYFSVVCVDLRCCSFLSVGWRVRPSTFFDFTLSPHLQLQCSAVKRQSKSCFRSSCMQEKSFCIANAPVSRRAEGWKSRSEQTPCWLIGSSPAAGGVWYFHFASLNKYYILFVVWAELDAHGASQEEVGIVSVHLNPAFDF